MALDPITGLAIASLASSAFSAFSGRKAAKAKAEEYSRQAEINRLQAQEVLKRAKINSSILRKEGDRFKASQLSGFAAGNVSLGSGSVLNSLAETEISIKQELNNINEEAKFRARMLELGAQSIDRQVSNIRKSSTYDMINSLFGSLANTGLKFYPTKSGSGDDLASLKKHVYGSGGYNFSNYSDSFGLTGREG